MGYITIIITVIIFFILIYRHYEVRKNYTKSQIEQKENRKKFILDYLHHHPKITNSDIRELFEVSDQTAVNYLDELEAEGKILQIGEHGRGVYYILK